MPEGYTMCAPQEKLRKPSTTRFSARRRLRRVPTARTAFSALKSGKKRAKRRYDLPGLGSRMHEEKTGAFLRSLCANVKTRPQVEYTLGFLSHYAADTVVHPFICAMCAPGQPYAGKGGHGYLEIALDSNAPRRGHRLCAGSRR